MNSPIAAEPRSQPLTARSANSASNPSGRTECLAGAEKNMFGNLRLLCLSLALGAALPAMAALGGDVNSVVADRERLQGTAQITRVQDYEVHEIRAATGTVVREYVAPSGFVFAITWHGASNPDMRQLLGRYYDQYVQAAQTNRLARGPLVIKAPGLVVQVSGHMRGFVGRAYVPGMLPAGVQAEGIR